LDLRARQDGAPITALPWVVDIKTAAEHTNLWRLQTAGYAACLRDPHKRASLQLFPDGRYRFFPYDRPEHAFDAVAWTSAATLHHWRAANLKAPRQ
jgi:hypothetical protein